MLGEAAATGGSFIPTATCVENRSSYCSTGENEAKISSTKDWKRSKELAGTTGLEPATSDVTGAEKNLKIQLLS